jgi:O-antigen ligase
VLFYSTFGILSFYIVYKMQSRGAVFGAAAALIFILLVSSRMRRYALPFAVLALVFVFVTESPTQVAGRVGQYLARGQNAEQFESMSGRTRAWEHGLAAFTEAPFFGRGQWTDRLTIGEHVHNSYLQALMDGGIVGGIPYCLSWVFGWFLFMKLLKQRDKLNPIDRVMLLECGTVMMFFSVRSIPETTTASFAVDLLVMTAVYVYLETISRSRAPIAIRRVAPSRYRLVRRKELPRAAFDAGPGIADSVTYRGK